MGAGPERRAHPRPIESIDESERRARRGYRLPVPENRPWPVFFVVGILLIVVLVVIALRGTIPPAAGATHRPTYSIVASGSSWPLGPGTFRSVPFKTSVNATLSGNFTSFGTAVNVLLMSAPQYYRFVNNTTQPSSLNATDGVFLGGFAWGLDPPGVFWLVAWNYDVHHSTTVNWVTSVQWYQQKAPNRG
ncbi:MAG: hypothetical protein WBG19_02870 [Thermoplasmata archaeon]